MNSRNVQCFRADLCIPDQDGARYGGNIVALEPKLEKIILASANTVILTTTGESGKFPQVSSASVRTRTSCFSTS
jgi:hypothetical protein